MKTAISIPNEVFEAADELARELGVSRSQLYSRAVAELLARSKDSEITRKLDEVYADESSTLEQGLRELQAASVADERW